MASKLVLFLVAAFTVATVRASNFAEDFKDEEEYSLGVSTPVKAAIPAPSTPSTPVAKPPSSPIPVPTTPSTPVAKPPSAPSTPLVKPPSTAPAPVVGKQPTPAPAVKPPAPPVSPPIPSPPFPPVRTLSDCTPLCGGRCRLHSRPNVCIRACKACCYRCKCVPPGTYGNREKCGKCYTQMTTRNNKPKCP